jgi:hypothetical protein
VNAAYFLGEALRSQSATPLEPSAPKIGRRTPSTWPVVYAFVTIIIGSGVLNLNMDNQEAFDWTEEEREAADGPL